jgi:hypothetical protein
MQDTIACGTPLAYAQLLEFMNISILSYGILKFLFYLCTLSILITYSVHNLFLFLLTSKTTFNLCLSIYFSMLNLISQSCMHVSILLNFSVYEPVISNLQFMCVCLSQSSFYIPFLNLVYNDLYFPSSFYICLCFPIIRLHVSVFSKFQSMYNVSIFNLYKFIFHNIKSTCLYVSTFHNLHSVMYVFPLPSV